MKELRGSKGLKMVLKTVVLPCLSFSFALKVLLVVLLMSIHLVLVNFASLRSCNHILGRSCIVLPPCLTFLLEG